MAGRMGATHLVNASKTDAGRMIRDIVGAADVFIDNTGIPSVIELGYELTKSQGRITLVGVPKKGNNISLYSLPMHFGKRISGSHGGEAVPHEDIPRYHELYRVRRIKLRELLTDDFPVTEINEAIAAMRSGEISGRCLIRFGT